MILQGKVNSQSTKAVDGPVFFEALDPAVPEPKLIEFSVLNTK